MSICVAVSYFPGEVPWVPEGYVSLPLPFDTFAASLNAALPILEGHVLVVHGIEMVGNWAPFLLGMMEMGASAVSPYTESGGYLAEPIDTIGADAYLTHTEVLRRVGGLDERVMFGHHRLLAYQINAFGGWVGQTADSVAHLRMDPARLQALGNLYYRQIEDDDMIRTIMRGAS